MNKIGFKNFRKFENFPMLSLGDTTLLVGSNNAGKSTFVKAALIIYNLIHTRVGDFRNNNLLDSLTPKVNFDVTEPYDVHIGTFARAKRRNADVTDVLVFDFDLEGFEVEVRVNSRIVDNKIDQDSSDADIKYISIKDSYNNVEYSVDYTTQRMYVEFHKSITDKESKDIKNAVKERDEIEEALKVEKDFKKILDLKSRLSELDKKYHSLDKENNMKSYKLDVPNREYCDSVSEYYLVNIIKSFIEYGKEPLNSTLDKKSKEYKKEFQDKTILQTKLNIMEDSMKKIGYVIPLTEMEYIYAHAARQIIFFNSKDKNDYMAQAIHEFNTSKAIYDNSVQVFINKWMKEFKIGESYTIKNHGGEAYEVFIDNDTEVSNMADMGMGSIQLMILLFKLGTYIKKYGNRKYPPTILIEEPEQNIHPILQSKLADMFLFLNENFNFRFIIETHSEYLVRHCQVLAAKRIYEEKVPVEEINKSIKVYYFSEERGPVDMLFMDNAKFQETFDEGFFDQAAREALTISRLERLHNRK